MADSNLIWFVGYLNHGKDSLQFHVVDGEEFMVLGVAEHFTQYQGKLDTVIDIGAHIGELSILAAQRGAKHIWAIEPDPGNFELLYENIGINEYSSRILPFQLAVAKKQKQVKLRKPNNGGNTGQRSIIYSNDQPVCAEVNGITLSYLIELFAPSFSGEGIDYLKMDIEGAEHEVIMSTPKELLLRIAWLDLDVHDLNNRDYFEGGGKPQELLDYLADCGFVEVNRNGNEKAFHMMLQRIGKCSA